MGEPIELDLRRDLPKVRERWRKVVRQRGKCRYAAPCIVGAMVPPELRADLDMPLDGKIGSPTVGSLITAGKITVPKDHAADLIELQIVYDNEDLESFKEELARVEAKYLGKSQ